MTSRRRLRSSTPHRCRPVQDPPWLYRGPFTTVGSRSFSVAGPHVWNRMSSEVTSAPSLATFHTPLKTFLFT